MQHSSLLEHSGNVTSVSLGGGQGVLGGEQGGLEGGQGELGGGQRLLRGVLVSGSRDRWSLSPGQDSHHCPQDSQHPQVPGQGGAQAAQGEEVLPMTGRMIDQWVEEAGQVDGPDGGGGGRQAV